MSYDIYRQQLLNVPLTREKCVYVSKVYLCYCRINTEHKHPFLEFKLIKNNLKELTFDSFNATVTRDISIYDFIKLNMPKYNKSEFKNDILGYIIFKNAIYCFVKFQGLNKNLYRSAETGAIVLSDEIVNQRQYFNMPISDLVYLFFIKNQHCLYLKTADKKQILTPKSYYYGDTLMKKDYLLQHGIPKQVYLGMFGSYYYVCSFKDAILNGGWAPTRGTLNPKIADSNGKYRQGAIYRCILFIESSHCKLTNTVDESSVTNMLIQQSRDFSIENKHISDRDAKWSDLYDTIYSGVSDKMPYNIIAHKYPVYITNYVKLNMSSLPMNKTVNYTNIKIL
tara:strand:+ start:1322 stop:2335 length:1014 start_codon:yes stop_codon:yes gene_type:complete